jgi:hypothetical protein
MRNARIAIITVLLMILSTACAGKTVIGKPTCVKPVIKISVDKIETDRQMLQVLADLVTLVEQQESALECYEHSFK